MTDIFKLYWSDKHLGDIQNVRTFDFPWVIGDFAPGNIDRELAEVLEWFAKVAEAEEEENDDDLPEPPFSEELTDNWYIEKPDGTREAISVPILDKKDGTITWR